MERRILVDVGPSGAGASEATRPRRWRRRDRRPTRTIGYLAVPCRRRIRLTVLTADDMRLVAAGDAMTHADPMSVCGHPCFTDENVCLTIKALCVTVG